MKRLSIIICVVALIGASLQSCSDNKSANMETPNAPMKIRGNNSRDTTHRQSRFDVYYLVDEYPEFFGSKVLIFDSLPCVDSLLCELSEADPSDLRDLYSNLCIYNPIIESNIIYDSVMNAIAEDLRIDLESDTLTETTLAWFLDEFTQTMVDWYADQCIVGEAINDELESYQTVSPIGNIDERALCNEMGIFIADQVVFKFSGDYLLTCPADIYVLLAGYDNMEDLMYDFETTGIDGVNEDDFIVGVISGSDNSDESFRNGMRPINRHANDHWRNYVGTNGDRKITNYITIYPVWSWFETKFRCKMTISNYFRGSMVKAKVRCNFSCTGVGWNVYNSDELDYHSYLYGLRNIWNQPIMSSFNSRTFMEDDYSFQYMPTLRTYVDITHLYLSMAQNENTRYKITVYESE